MINVVVVMKSILVIYLFQLLNLIDNKEKNLNSN